MKRLTLVITTFALFTTLFPVQSQPQSTSSIAGIILDESTNNGLDYVNIILYKASSNTPYKSTASGEDGHFRFNTVASGDYRIEATFVGYVTWKSEIKVSDGQQIQLGTILLKTESKQLGTAEVVGIRSAMRLDIDKRVFSVDQNIAAAGASASDILKDIPSVEVDQEGTVSLRNNSNVTIWVNGKPAGLNSDNQAQVLEQMPAESIDRIEVVTNPSSKFSAEGTAGIINIILKKDRKAGYYGSLRAGISDPFGYDFGGNINYSSSKIDFYANIGRRSHSNEGSGYSNRQTYTTNEQTLLTDTSWLHSTTNRTFGMQGLFFRGGIDYHLNDKHTISLSGFGMKGDRGFESDIDYLYLDNNKDLIQQVLRHTSSGGGHSHMEITLDYQWEIGEEHLFQTNLTYGKHTMSNDNDYIQSYYDVTNMLTNTVSQVQTGPGENRDWEFQADYTNKLSENFRLETGLKSDWTVRKSNNNIYNTASVTTASIPDYTSDFDYNEQIHAAYGTFTGKLGGFGYQLGLRGELTAISFVSSNFPAGDYLDKDKNYFNLFPSIFLSYTFSPGNDLQLNFSRRINRPRGRSLNPFTDISDSTNIYFGNPDLEPEFSDAFELNYIKVWDNHTLSSSLYHRMTDNVIQDIRYLDNGIIYQTPSNVTNSTSSGLELVAKDKLAKWIETTSTINFYYTTMEGFTYRSVDYKGSSGFSWNARLNSTLIFSRSLTGQISGFYNAPGIIAQGKTRRNFTLDAGLRKSFLDKTFLIAINGRNILNSFKFASTNWGDGFYQENSNQFFGRTIQLTVTWNFGNIKPKEKQGQAENGNSNDSDNSMGGDY